MEGINTGMRELGKSGVMVPQMGVGTMLWTSPKKEDEIMEAYTECLNNGINFFDTAEIYGMGESERILGRCMKRDGRPAIITTKFAPPSKMMPFNKRKKVPYDSPDALLEALEGSLSRLGVDCIDLYQMHMPPSKNNIADYMNVMAKAVREGKIRTVGL